ncbi:MAG: hypothetical protein HZA93_23775 [Verrucomicrobia bacterium]|nr:hypothetical protein [Verrucomicrobiota bacterium]
MHYKNGREAKVGDRVVVPNNGKPFIGLLSEVNAGSDTCNGQVIPMPASSHYVTLKEILHVDDALAKG